MDEKCVVCGDIVPEGVRVCPKCYWDKSKIKTNFDRVKALSPEMFVKLFPGKCLIAIYGEERRCENQPSCAECMVDWLKTEVKE